MQRGTERGRRGAERGDPRRRGRATQRRRDHATLVRRRRLRLLAGAAAAFVAGAALGAGGGGGSGGARRDPAGAAANGASADHGDRAPVERLTLEQQVGRLVVLRFAGLDAPGYVRRALREGRAAGAILFRDNVASPQQLRRLTGELRAAGRAAGATPIVCADQEGGPVRILPWAPPASAPSAQDPEPDARAAGTALRAAGVNVALAPVADVPRPGTALAARAFSADPERTAAAVAAAVRGWRAAGVAATAKHFPGLGWATANTDHAPVTAAAGIPTDGDLAPFRAAIAAGVPLVMASHATYPALDPHHIASQSPAILRDLLRGRLGFHGVVITDSIEAAAVRAVAQPGPAALQSVAAGADVVLTTGRGSYVDVYRALLDEAKRSPAFRATVRASAARVLELQQRLR